MTRVVFSPLAQNDLIEIGEFIARDDPDAALRYVREIYRACSVLTEQPRLGRVRSDLRAGELRSIPIRSHVIYYRLVRLNVEVIRILHGARDARALL